MPVPDPRPATPPACPRVPLAQAARAAETAAPSVLDRILTPGDKQHVDVASFQSSI
jgi:hypothetical protein